jgi:NAD(P)-dependent dehydrogenase (short-subunit alcohol dehydrogenase family)
VIDAHHRLAGDVAVVIGATGGIGSAVVRRLAESGASTVLGFRRDRSAADGLLASLHEVPEGVGHTAIQCDVTDSVSLSRLAEQLQARYGRVDLLVNCAGMTRFVHHADLASLDDGLIDEIFRTNWRGAFATIRALQSLLEEAARRKRSDAALVVNISSVAATIGMGSNVAYCASKAALNAMTISLARALAPTIRVVSVSPGVVDTEFIRGLDPSWLDEQVRRTPLGRLVSPGEVADAVLATATILRSSTGCVIPVDGGRPLA